MSYPFVKAHLQLGPRKGPVRAFLVHMAEGGGTVAYLAKPNPNNVSVHYVIERTGRIVQMVPESDASGSVNPRDIRTTDDPDGFYGVTAAKAVMGDWHRDPNSAVISLEIEGFAKDGPNPAQAGALFRLVEDVRSRHPQIGLLGHRDFADYKACPGKLIPWTVLGGHGPSEDDVLKPGDDFNYGWESWTIDAGEATARTVYCLGGPRLPDGTTDRTMRLCAAGPDSAVLTVVSRSRLTDPKPLPGSPALYQAITSGALPVADCTDPITAELERAADRAHAAVLAR